MPEESSLAFIDLRFESLLNKHIREGVRPNKSKKKKYRPWTNITIAHNLGVTSNTVKRWREGVTFPTADNFVGLLKIFFGENFSAAEEAIEMITAYNRFSPFYYVPEMGLLVLDEDQTDDLATQQIPAAFRFGLSDGKIDALPEHPETIDESAAQDIYNELREKLRITIERLEQSNSDRQALFAAQRLETALGTNFLDVRPGILLSRMRSVEAVSKIFNSSEGKAMLFPDAIARFEDVCLTGQDLLATFPTVRQIEREHIALGLEKDAEVISELNTDKRIPKCCEQKRDCSGKGNRRVA